jgi:hypothetical protein
MLHAACAVGANGADSGWGACAPRVASLSQLLLRGGQPQPRVQLLQQACLHVLLPCFCSPGGVACWRGGGRGWCEVEGRHAVQQRGCWPPPAGTHAPRFAAHTHTHNRAQPPPQAKKLKSCQLNQLLMSLNPQKGPEPHLQARESAQVVPVCTTLDRETSTSYQALSNRLKYSSPTSSSMPSAYRSLCAAIGPCFLFADCVPRRLSGTAP